MYGTLAVNSQIRKLLEERAIYIHPFFPELLRTAHYPLHAHSISERLPNGSYRQVHRFDESASFTFQPFQG